MPTSSHCAKTPYESTGITAIAAYPMPSQEHIPTSRVKWIPSPSRCALLIHDMQLFFLNKYDQQQAPIPQLIDHTRMILTLAHSLQIPVFYTAQPPQQTAAERGLLNDMWGAGINHYPEQATICEPLAPQSGDHVLKKWRYSAFKRSDFEEQLKRMGRDQLLITGIFAHIGCMATALDAFMLDIQPFFIADALADFSRKDHDMALEHVANRCGVCLSTTQVIDALTNFSVDKKEKRDTNTRAIAEMEQKVAELFGHPVSEIPENENLSWLGMDSIRLMMLADHLSQQGYHITFADLAETPTLMHWRQLVTQHNTAVNA